MVILELEVHELAKEIHEKTLNFLFSKILFKICIIFQNILENWQNISYHHSKLSGIICHSWSINKLDFFVNDEYFHKMTNSKFCHFMESFGILMSQIVPNNGKGKGFTWIFRKMAYF